MAKVKGLFQREGYWWARKDVPKPLRALVGRTSLQRSLETNDIKIALVRFPSVMTEFERTITDARDKLAGKPESVESVRTAMSKIVIHVPPNPFADLTPKVALGTIFDEWKRAKEPRPNTVTEYRRAMELFIAMNGDLSITRYTREHGRRWRDHCMAIAGAHATREKWFGAIRTLFRYADRNDYLTANPFEKVVLEVPNRPVVNRRQEWEPDDLQTWFSSPIYTERFRPKGGMGEAAYWLPVLGLYHGFRLGEMCQLRKADLIPKNGIHCLIIRPSDEDDDGPERTVKTTESERKVPLHKDVVEDFLAYGDTVEGEQMFPLIRPDTRGRWSGHWSKWFGRYRRTIGLDKRWIDFHSFRHSWKTAARAARIDPANHDELSGHEPGSIGATYGKVPIPILKQDIDKINFDVTIPKWSA